ncbi:MAG: leucyl aminopeptidase [Patiriisocius sp.]|jgi:leucyl aminopeptidase
MIYQTKFQLLLLKGNEAVIYMTQNAAHLLHDRVLVHGPGYIFKASKEAVLESLQRTPQGVRSVIDFTLTEETSVSAALQVINTQNIEDHILELEAYGT